MGNGFENQGRAYEVPDDKHSLRTTADADGRHNVDVWRTQAAEKTMGVLKTEGGSKMVLQLRTELAEVDQEIAAKMAVVDDLKTNLVKGQIMTAGTVDERERTRNEKIEKEGEAEIRTLETRIDLLKARRASLENDLKTL